MQDSCIINMLGNVQKTSDITEKTSYTLSQIGKYTRCDFNAQ